jgi:hypothetical protein
MDAHAGANARVSRASGSRTAPYISWELHWYEASGIGRKEFKIKNLL